MLNATAESYLTPHPLLHPILPLPPHPLSQTKNSKPSNIVKLIGLAISDKPLYPQITLVLMKHASIATAWGISASIVNSTPILLASAMPLIMSKTIAHFIITITQLTPYLPHLLCPTILPLPLDQSAWYPLHWQTDSLLPPLDGPSMDPVALISPLHLSTPLLSDSAVPVLPPQVLTTTMSMTLMLGVTSMGSRIFQQCLNATMGVMLQLSISFSFPLYSYAFPLYHY